MTNIKEERIKTANDALLEKGKLSIVDDIFVTDYVAHSGGNDYQGHEFIKRFINQLRTAVPDIRVVNVAFYLQMEDTIVWQRTLSGTHKADMMGAPSTNQKLEWREMVVSRFDGEKIAEEWVVSELAGEMLSKPPRV